MSGMEKKAVDAPDQQHSAADSEPAGTETAVTVPENPEASDEVGGPKGPEPTRYGDWERKGRCVDF